MPGHLRYWTRREERRLAALYHAEYSTRQIAAMLGRTIWAVERRASDLRRRGEPILRARRCSDTDHRQDGNKHLVGPEGLEPPTQAL